MKSARFSEQNNALLESINMLCIGLMETKDEPMGDVLQQYFKKYRKDFETKKRREARIQKEKELRKNNNPDPRNFKQMPSKGSGLDFQFSTATTANTFMPQNPDGIVNQGTYTF